MQHSDLLEAMATDLGSKKAAKEAADAFIRAMWYGLKCDGKVIVRDLGTFEVKFMPARRVRNVRRDGQRGELVNVPRSKLIAFSMSKPLKRELRDGGG